MTPLHRLNPLHIAMLVVLLGSANRTYANAQELTVSGYVMDLPSVQWLRPELASLGGVKETQVSNILRVRVRPTAVMWEGATFAAEYEADWLASNSLGGLAIKPDLTHRQLYHLRWTVADGAHHHVEHFIDRLALRVNLDEGSLIVGRQRVSWGTGRMWNPTDLFHPMNPVVFGKIEKDGVDAVSAKFAFGSFTDVQAVINAGKSLKNINAGVRFRGNTQEQDYSFLAGYFDKRAVLGADLAGNLAEAGIRAEALYSFASDDAGAAYASWIAGIDYQFTPEVYTALEYHYNGAGATSTNLYRLDHVLRGRALNLGRNFLGLMANVQLHPLLQGTVNITRSLTDASMFGHLAATWSASDEATATLGAMLFLGDRGDEFWYYPRTLYLRGAWYF